MIALDASYTDWGLLAAILLGSSYIYNQGSLLPKSDPHRYLFYKKPQEVDGISQKAAVTRDIGEKVRNDEAQFVIFWGSQSGTAEGLANGLARDINQRLGSVAVVADLSDYEPRSLANLTASVMVVLVMSTYGEGEPSDNAQDFMTQIASMSGGSLSLVRFAAFGCGNSTYRYYNKIIHDTSALMERCGAKKVFPVGLGDEAMRSTIEDFMEWKERYFSVLASEHGHSVKQSEYEPSTDVILEDTPEGRTSDLEESQHLYKNAAHVPITSRNIIATYDDQSQTCIDLRLSIAEHPQLKYRTGDHVAIWPSNPQGEVNRLLRVLGLENEAQKCVRIAPKDKRTETKAPALTRLDTLLSRHLEICAPVPRETVLVLAQLAPTRKGREYLEKIGSRREDYAVFLESNYMTLARLMEFVVALDPKVSWGSLPLSFLIDFLPTMKPRLYSISTSSKVEPRQIGVVASVKPGRVVKSPETLILGLASTYLSDTPVVEASKDNSSSLVHIEVRQSSFKLPFSPRTPVIMIAAGTGIAPFRAFVHERARLASIGRDVGPMLLFFGCQNNSNCLCFDELFEIASRSGKNALRLQIFTAFSRPQHGSGNIPAKRMYVQDQILHHRQEVVRQMLIEDASLYICGSTTMAKAVEDVIRAAVKDERQWSPEEALNWRQTMRKNGRWHEDVWG